MQTFWQLSYCTKEALANIRRHLWPSLVAISSISVLLFLVGLGGWAWMSFEQLAARWKEKARVVVFLEDGAGPAEQDAVARALADRREIEQVKFVSKSEAMERLKASLDGQKDVLEGLGESPLPASFVATLKPAERRAASLERVAKAVGGMPGVDEVQYGEPWLSKIEAIGETGRKAGLGWLALLAAALFLVIHNTSKLAPYARIEELEILKLVGASPFLLRGPYIIEGALKGLVGGLAACTAIVLMLATLEARYGARLVEVLGFWPTSKQALAAAGATVLLGLVLGVLGGAVATRPVVKRLP